MAAPTTRIEENARLRRAKKFNVGTSAASGVLGVGALGALAARGAPRVAARTGMSAARAKRIAQAGEKATVPLSAASLGVGGVGSLNFARVQNQEANMLPKFNRKTGRTEMPRRNVTKSYTGLDMGLSTVSQGVGNVEKRYYDPEERRNARLDAASGVLAAGAGATGLAGTRHARDARNAWKSSRAGKARYGDAAGALLGGGKVNAGAKRMQAANARRVWEAGNKLTRRSGAKAAGFGAGAAGLLVGADQIQRYKRNGGGRSYNVRNWD